MQLREEAWLYVEAVAAEVEAVYRSQETVELEAGKAPTLAVEALVCGIRKEEESRVYLVLHNKSCKRSLIYSVLAESEGKNGFDAALKTALAACQALGFSMGSINLKCSTAMREVVIRNIPVLLAPAAARKAAAQRAEMLAELERLAMEPEMDEATEEAAGGLSPARRAAREKARQERQEEIKAAVKKLAAESDVDACEAATRRAVRTRLAAIVEVTGGMVVSAPAHTELKTPDGSMRRPPSASPVALPPSKEAPPIEAGPATGEKLPLSVERQPAETQETQRLERELERLLAEKAVVEQRVAELTATARQAAEEAERERAERERLEAEKAAAEKWAQELAAATREAELRANAERVQRERLNAEKAAAEQRAAELAEAARTAEVRTQAWRDEQQRQLDMQAQRVQAEREQLLAEKAAAERQAAAMAEAVRDAEQKVEIERGEREQLLAEKAAAEQRARTLAEAVRQVEFQVSANQAEKEQLALAQADRERSEREQLVAEKLAAERRAAELTEAVQLAERQFAVERAERERLNVEKMAAERRAAELAEAARRAAELAEAARQAALRAEQERRERERLEAEKAQAESRLQLQPAVALQAEPKLSEPGRRREALPSLGGLFAHSAKTPEPPVSPAPKMVSRPAVSGAFFQVDPELAVIACESVDDVLEVQQSISMTQLSLEGFPNQYCMAYVVALKKGAARQVHVAFRLTTSDRILIYSPPKPPRDQQAYARAMQEALRFLRVTGIETERVPLGKSPQSRRRALDQIPVLRIRTQSQMQS